MRSMNLDGASILEQLPAYEDAGVQELMLQWFDLDDIDGLRSFAKKVLHR